MRMRHREGPSKRLAPAISLDISCPHCFVEDEGIQLEVDCSECAGAHDLSNARCLAGVVSVVSSGAIPETVILKRFAHRRYRRETVDIVAIAAGELSAVNRALATSFPASDKNCRTCSASRSSVLTDLKRRLMNDPGAYVSDAAKVLEEINRARASTTCARAKECVRSGVSASTILGEDWR